MIKRRQSRVVRIGSLQVGGDNPVVVQSMCSTDTRNVDATVSQIRVLQEAGCELIRVAVLDEVAALAIADIKRQISIPLIADIHFDYRLALNSIDSGADGLRINPGNIGERSKVETLVRRCQERGIPIRIGVNAGSLDKSILRKHGEASAAAMVESGLEHVRILEDLDFRDIKISLKASDVMTTVEAYRLMADAVDYPLHLGITEAGTKDRGLIKSALGIGMLLAEGIGDTVRVSLTADPVEEVWAAYEILRDLGLRRRGVELVSCPTCGRCEIDLISAAEEIDAYVRNIVAPLKIAVMGCVVNGPGEARDADAGLAGGRDQALIFRRGEIIGKVPQSEMISALKREIDALAAVANTAIENK